MPSAIDTFMESINLAKRNYISLILLYIALVVILAIVVFVGLIGIAAGSLGVLGSAFATPYGVVSLVAIALIITFIISPVWNGAYYSIAIQSLKGKGKASLGKAFKESSNAYGKLLWTFIIQTVITIVIMAIICLPLILALAPALSQSSSIMGHALRADIPLIIVTAIVAVVVGVALDILFFVAMPLAMLKGISGMAAIKNSVAIGRKNWLSILTLIILILIMGVVIYVVTEILAVVLGLISPILTAIVSIVVIMLIDSLIAGIVGFLPIVFYKRYVKR